MYRADHWITLKNIIPIPADYETERALNWAAGTLEVLRHVSILRLDRYTGWQCPDTPRFIDAGRVYKRGVAVNRVKEVPSFLSPSELNIDADRVYKRGVAVNRVKEVPSFLSPSKVDVVEDLYHLIPHFSKDRFILIDVNTLPVLDYFKEIGLKIELHDTPMIIKDVSENIKRLEMVAYILNKWRESNGRMRWTVVGGGITSDICAFAASCVGARIDIIPTTLLAMVDASFGGKTGVNSGFGKNHIGSYYFPDTVTSCPHWLMGLPLEEIYAGSWECIKLALLVGDLQLVDKWLTKIEDNPRENIGKLIWSTCLIKNRFLDNDPFEIYDQRLLMNLGHTLGHALETVAWRNESKKLRHGEAVGVGLIYMLLLSKKLNKLSTADDLLSRLGRHQGLLTKQQLAKKTKVDNLDELWSKLLPIIDNDKKRYGNRVPWVVLQDQQNDDGFYAQLTFVDDQQLLLDCWRQLLKVIS